MEREGDQVAESSQREPLKLPLPLDGTLRIDRPLRADAARTMRKILEVAEEVLSKDPAATLEKIAAAAGVARTTVYRRFATREALIDAMSEVAMREVEQAIDEGRPENAPPMVAFHQITANLIEIKSGWRFTMNQAHALHGTAAKIHGRIFDKCMRLLERAQAAGYIRPEVDLGWARSAYHALIEQAFRERAETGRDPDELAERLVDTLWDEDPPRTAVSSVRTHIYHLRGIVRRLGYPAISEQLTTELSGYTLKIDPESIDSEVFSRLVVEGKAMLHSERFEEASYLLGRALDLWRGQPMAKVDTRPGLTPHAVQLREERLSTLQLRIEADMRLGRHRELIGELKGLVAADPYNEGFHPRLIH